MKKRITRSEYLQLLGLLTLANRHYSMTRDIEKAMCAITGEPFDGGGHTGDAIYSEQVDVDDLIDKLQITVMDEPTRDGERSSTRSPEPMVR